MGQPPSQLLAKRLESYFCLEGAGALASDFLQGSGDARKNVHRYGENDCRVLFPLRFQLMSADSEELDTDRLLGQQTGRIHQPLGRRELALAWMIFDRFSRSASACLAMARSMDSGKSTCLTSTFATFTPHGAVCVSRMDCRRMLIFFPAGQQFVQLHLAQD